VSVFKNKKFFSLTLQQVSNNLPSIITILTYQLMRIRVTTSVNVVGSLACALAQSPVSGVLYEEKGWKALGCFETSFEKPMKRVFFFFFFFFFFFCSSPGRSGGVVPYSMTFVDCFQHIFAFGVGISDRFNVIVNLAFLIVLKGNWKCFFWCLLNDLGFENVDPGFQG